MSFFRDYLTYATGNEAPRMFHLWGSMVCLSAAISRTVWLPFEDTAIYPNIYVLYVGAAGNGKSWAMQKAKRLLSELRDPIVPISASVETAPGMWQYMTGVPVDPQKPNGARKGSVVARPAVWPDGVMRDIHPMTIFANEFINFISCDDAGWINALNDIYDEDLYRYRTKGQGDDIVQGPYIVMLGALTTEVSADLQKQNIISTGLARRTIFQFGERQWFDPVPKPAFTKAQQEARARAVDWLKRLREVKGQFIWTPAVDDWWSRWYPEQLSLVPTKPPQTQGWFASKSIQVMKIAMLNALGKRMSLTLTPEDFDDATAYLEECEKDLFRIFGGAGRNELASVAVKVYEFLANQKTPLSLKKVRSHFWHMCRPPNEFEAVLQHLVDNGQVKQYDLKVQSGRDVVTELVLATPEVAAAFVAKQLGQPVEVQTDLQSGLAAATDLSPAPATPPSGPPSSVALPISAPPSVGTKAAQILRDL